VAGVRYRRNNMVVEVKTRSNVWKRWCRRRLAVMYGRGGEGDRGGVEL